MTESESFTMRQKKERDGLSTLHQFEGLLDVKSIRIHCESMPPGGNAGDGKSDIII